MHCRVEVVEMESGESSSSSNERHSVLKDSSWFRQFRNGSNPWMARYVYALIFLVATLLAWAARDYGGSALTEMESKIARETYMSSFCLICTFVDIDVFDQWFLGLSSLSST